MQVASSKESKLAPASLAHEQRPAHGSEGPAAAGGGARASARTWSKMGSSTLSNTRAQNGGVNAAPWNLSVSNSTCAAGARSAALVGTAKRPHTICSPPVQASRQGRACAAPRGPATGAARTRARRTHRSASPSCTHKWSTRAARISRNARHTENASASGASSGAAASAASRPGCWQGRVAPWQAHGRERVPLAPRARSSGCPAAGRR